MRFSFTFLLVGVHCFAMQPNSFDKFLIGSEDGHIYLCTTQFSSEALRSFDAHHTPVQTISWNTYIPSVFISCASELMVKIWTKDLRQPMFSFDLQSQVNFAYIDSPKFCYIFKGTWRLLGSLLEYGVCGCNCGWKTACLWPLHMQVQSNLCPTNCTQEES